MARVIFILRQRVRLLFMKMVTYSCLHHRPWVSAGLVYVIYTPARCGMKWIKSWLTGQKFRRNPVMHASWLQNLLTKKLIWCACLLKIWPLPILWHILMHRVLYPVLQPAMMALPGWNFQQRQQAVTIYRKPCNF
ncbi:Uncharacterised protein [Candidatus Venteria ishoeyi]|uniref:Uncharacterized protein n=1 Tax=Candidatus Venteria ishoeyi TaxID=1899563 RepID=A0A1H6FGJ6_9GAMM|nr:Uncharacterised protein [Candidatus Venteria ishoeyi]